MSPPPPRVLLTLPARPESDPQRWAEAEARGPGAVAVIARPALTGTSTDEARAVRRLVLDGATPLGRVDLDYGARPIDAALAEIDVWAALQVRGIFFDRAPAGPFPFEGIVRIDPVVEAVRAARRAGLSGNVINAGVDVDPAYRRLKAIVCTFEGTWAQYRSRPSPGSADGQLVLAVPTAEMPVARATVLARQASLYLVTERPTVFDPVPATRGGRSGPAASPQWIV